MRTSRLTERRTRRALAISVIAACASAALALAAATSLAASKRPAAKHTGLTLKQCLKRWNQAALGHGRLYAATAGPRGLLFAFSDGVCGLAISPATADKSDSALVYVQVLNGTYTWGLDPVGINATPQSSQIEAAAARATKHPNVRTAAKGRHLLTGIPGGVLAKFAFPEASTVTKHTSCPTIPDPPTYYDQHPTEYTVTSTTVGCAVTREIVWAYSDHEGQLLKPASAGVRELVGWRCSGSSAQITCTKGSNKIEVQRAPVQTVPPGSPTPPGSPAPPTSPCGPPPGGEAEAPAIFCPQTSVRGT
jgi:hypothetical protein